MERHDYMEQMVRDIKEYVYENGIDVQEFGIEDELQDRLFVDDAITGNASGSYTFNSWRAEEYLCHNWELLGEACTEFCVDSSVVEKGAEYCDVLIRCYLLPQAISAALEDLRGA